MYKIGQIAYDDMFAEDSEALDYERDIIFIYKKAVEYGDDFFVGTAKLDAIVEKLASKISVYDYGLLTPVYSDVLSNITNVMIGGAALNDLTDVTISNVLDNQILRYNATLGQWVNVAPGSAIRNSQTFIATAGQSIFTTAYPFDSGLFDVYLNGVRLNTDSFTTMGEYQITLVEPAIADDIIDVVIYDADTNILNPINSLSDLDDVTIGPLSNKQALYFNSTSGKWENGAVFVPYTGAIANVDLGNFDLTADIITANSLVKIGGTSTQILRADGQVYNFPLNISSPTNGQVLKYNGTSWVNDSDAGITGSGVSGQVAYWSGTNTQTGSNNLFWDNANGRLGILGNTPIAPLTIFNAGDNNRSSVLLQSSEGTFRIGFRQGVAGLNTLVGELGLEWNDTKNTAIKFYRGGGTTGGFLAFTTNNDNERLRLTSAGNMGLGTTTPDNSANYSTFTINGTTGGQITLKSSETTIGYLYNTSTDVGLATNGVRNLLFVTNNLERGRFFGTGNFGINTGATDSGQRLQVNGDTLLRGSGNTSATTALLVQNSDSSSLFSVRNDGLIRVGNSGGAQFSAPQIYTSFSNETLNTGGATLVFNHRDSTVGTTNGGFFYTGTVYSPTSGANVFLNIARNFEPTSGTASFSLLQIRPAISQTGGANGITRGLYVNPNLALGSGPADWRSIEWSNNTGWGLYGAGTAQNFLAGNLGIGTTTINNSALRVNKAITGAVTQSSIANSSTINSDVTTAAWMYISSPSTQAAAFTLAEVVHFNAFNLTIGAGSTVTNQFGFRANSNLTAATNNYGFYGDIAAATGRWNLYMNGSASNYLNGGLVIGDTTALTGYNLRVNKQLGGATSAYGIASEPTFQAAVSSSGHGFFTSISLAASVSMVNLYHYRAQLSTLGAGSTITNQAAFLADGTITGATNNFGFQGGIAAGTGRWNAYMSGTAANYFNGNTIMGTLAADSGEKLQVNGTMKVTGASTFGGDITLTLNQNNPTSVHINNTNVNASAYARLNLTSNSGSASVSKLSSLYSGYKILTASNMSIYNATSGNINILNDFASGSIVMAAGGSSTAHFTIASNGRINMSSLPTSSAGLSAGDLWNDGGTLKIV